MLWPIKIEKVKEKEIEREGGKERGKRIGKKIGGAVVGRRWGRTKTHCGKVGLFCQLSPTSHTFHPNLWPQEARASGSWQSSNFPSTPSFWEVLPGNSRRPPPVP